MGPTETVREATLVEKVVLLGLVCRTVEGRTPTRLDEIRTVCNERLDVLTGRLSEADTCRALNALAETDLVEERVPSDRSPAGKGRLSYELCWDVDETLSVLADDRHLRPVVEAFDAVST